MISVKQLLVTFVLAVCIVRGANVPVKSPVASPSPVPVGRCGVGFGGAVCSGKMCCSQYGYCGTTVDYCGTGCQSNCLVVTTSSSVASASASKTSVASLSPSPVPAGRCGVGFGNAQCSDKSCCSQYGYCGTTVDYCGAGCQSNCLVASASVTSSSTSVASKTSTSVASPSPSPSPVPAGRCGVQFGNAQCSDKSCCSAYGYCGYTADFCGIGCQSNCVAAGVTYTQCNKPKKVALTFDDGVSAFTDTLLNTLSNNGVKATFFVIGQNLVGVGQKATLQKMYAAGHNIGSHTYTHPDLTTLTTAQVNSELQQTDALIKSIIGVSPKYFRPPYLAYNGAVDTVVKGYNYTTVMVGLDSNDWQYQATNPELIYSNIVDNFNKSSPIILQHDTYSSSVQLVDRIIKGIQAQSFRIVNMDECLNGA